MDEQLAIGHDLNNDGGRYWAEVPGGSAELTYKNRKDNVIVIDHTYVPPKSRGGKIAERLVERAVSDARERGLRIVPKCPYVAALFKRRPDLAELSAT
jgi:predicted GNAT family acetyltransferase